MNIHDLTTNPYTATGLCLHYCISNSAGGSQNLPTAARPRRPTPAAYIRPENHCRLRDIMQAVYILYIRTGIQLSLVRPSSVGPPSLSFSRSLSLSRIRFVLPFFDSSLCEGVAEIATHFFMPADIVIASRRKPRCREYWRSRLSCVSNFCTSLRGNTLFIFLKRLITIYNLNS